MIIKINLWAVPRDRSMLKEINYGSHTWIYQIFRGKCKAKKINKIVSNQDISRIIQVEISNGIKEIRIMAKRIARISTVLTTKEAFNNSKISSHKVCRFWTMIRFTSLGSESRSDQVSRIILLIKINKTLSSKCQTVMHKEKAPAL